MKAGIPVVSALTGSLLLLLLPAASMGRPQQPSPPSLPRFPAQVERVTVEVTVLDRSGQPVAGLQPEDFTVFEDGIQQEIAFFAPVEIPEQSPSAAGQPQTESPRRDAGEALIPDWTYVLLIDDIHLTPSQASDLRKAVTALLNALPAGARVVLIAVRARVVEDRVLPGGRKVLDERLASVRGAISTGRGEELISDQEAYDIFVRHDAVVEDLVTRRIVRLDLGDEIEKSDPFGERSAMLRAVTETRARAAKRYELMVRRSAATLGVLRNTLQWLGGVKGGKSVVLASRGFIREPSIREAEEVQRASLHANLAVSFLDARSQGGLSPFESPEYGPSLPVEDLPHTLADSFSEAAGAESLALDSGGLIIRYPKNLTKGIEQIVVRSRTRYLLGFQPTNRVHDGRFRRLAVRLRGQAQGCTALGRRGYYAPRDPER